MEGQQIMEAEEEKLDSTMDEGQLESSDGDSTQPEGEPTAAEQMFDVNGESVKLSELTSGYMKDSDYRKKTTELADQRREYDSNKEQLGKYQETIDYINGSPELLEQVNELLNTHYQGGQNQQGAPNIQKDEIPGWARQQQQELEDFKLDRAVDQIKGNPQFSAKLQTEDAVKDLLRFARDNKMTHNLVQAAKSYYYDDDTAGAKLKGAEEVTAGIQKKANVKPPIASGDGMTNPPQGDRTKMSMDQIIESQVADDLFK